jgi:hypothetical protein
LIAASISFCVIDLNKKKLNLKNETAECKIKKEFKAIATGCQEFEDLRGVKHVGLESWPIHGNGT